MARIVTDETSLTKRRRRLQGETQWLARIYLWEIGIGSTLLAAGILLGLFRHAYGLAILGGVIIFLGLSHRLKTAQNRDESQALEAGAQGEAQSARQLAEALDNTHYLFNDILIRHGLRAAQIDHLVVCPRGVFVVETKNWRGRIEGHGADNFWAQVKRPGEEPIRLKSPVTQVQRQAAVVAQVFRDAKRAPPTIVPVVAFASPKTELRVESPEVPVVHARDLGKVIAARELAAPATDADVDEWVNLITRRL